MTSTTIEERVRLRMRGGPPWGFRVEGSGGGPVYISSVSLTLKSFPEIIVKKFPNMLVSV